ncbi:MULTISPECIES: porin [unclassified Modicisalibacter]|uniref:porin n=1 Tax=unclassified Modicisalibacter TaxID=2679913 RepID=UPI001CC95E06|nr:MULTISPECIES: porin [unclassified Modicisalibacter]MBZ9557511.1 porin [Modicisalibacter sp. R2A 31.J]MBZ9573824.1 porin [Modicisalibacter sp. MOD 31.J]
MKKTLLATAIAGALGASAAAQAATVYNEDGTQFDIYGNLQFAYADTKDSSGDSQDEILDNGSTIGFKGQHVINPGLTGYFKYEFEGDADEIKGAGGIDTGDQAYMGLKGNFGDARIGSWDPLIDDWVQDPISNNEYFDVTDSNTLIDGSDGVNTQGDDDPEDSVYAQDREGDKIQYMSPSFGGFQFAVGSQYKGSAEEENVSNDGNASFFGGAKYTFGAFSVAAVYDNLDNYDGKITGSQYIGGADDGEDFDAGDQYGVTFQYTIESLRMALKYERYDSGNTDYIPDENRYALGARYGYGMGDIYGAYQYVDVGGEDIGDTIRDGTNSIGDNVDSRNEIVVGATYNISPAMYTFIEGAWYDRDNDENDGVAVGAVYSF